MGLSPVYSNEGRSNSHIKALGMFNTHIGDAGKSRKGSELLLKDLDTGKSPQVGRDTIPRVGNIMQNYTQVHQKMSARELMSPRLLGNG